MENTDTLVRVDLSARHIDDAMALVAAAGWNQCPDDWRMMIAAGTGTGYEDTHGQLVASAIVLPYGTGIGWIGMVLVAPDFQRRGLATRLTDRAVSVLEDAGLMPCLDATPAGEAVYLKRGFHTVFPFHRWHRLAGAADIDLVRPLSAVDIATVQSLDQAAFGASRDDLLMNVARRGSPCEVTLDRTGFALCRAGRVAHQIGPIVAATETAALDLFERMQGKLNGDVFIDIPDCHSMLMNRAQAIGFTRQRPFNRMIRGNCKINGPEAMFALFGPELG